MDHLHGAKCYPSSPSTSEMFPHFPSLAYTRPIGLSGTVDIAAVNAGGQPDEVLKLKLAGSSPVLQKTCIPMSPGVPIRSFMISTPPIETVLYNVP